MQRTCPDSTSRHKTIQIHSYWSNEDNAFLAEIVGVPGTLTDAETEQEARLSALELAQEWERIERDAQDLTQNEFTRWMDLDGEKVTRLQSLKFPENTRKSLQEWNRSLNEADHGQGP